MLMVKSFDRFTTFINLFTAMIYDGYPKLSTSTLQSVCSMHILSDLWVCSTFDCNSLELIPLQKCSSQLVQLTGDVVQLQQSFGTKDFHSRRICSVFGKPHLICPYVRWYLFHSTFLQTICLLVRKRFSHASSDSRCRMMRFKKG